MKFFFILLVYINAIAFTADCITYEYGENPQKITIITGNGKLILKGTTTNYNEIYYYKGRSKDGYFEYSDSGGVIEISLGQIKNKKLEFLLYYPNGDSEIGTCELR